MNSLSSWSSTQSSTWLSDGFPPCFLIIAWADLMAAESALHALSNAKSSSAAPESEKAETENDIEHATSDARSIFLLNILIPLALSTRCAGQEPQNAHRREDNHPAPAQ
jgi:hypothetical protein